jgi:hypothetical protein
MYNAVDALPRLLSNLEHVLREAEKNASERGIDETVFMQARLAPDMWSLAQQVQAAAELAKNAPFRIAGLDAPSYEGHPSSFKACYDLLERARTDIKTVSREDLDGKEGREFTLQMGPNKLKMEFTGISYLSGFSLPNVYFHVTTVYNILRHNGVPLGKRDFFGGVLK